MTVQNVDRPASDAEALVLHSGSGPVIAAALLTMLALSATTLLSGLPS
ncbi:hypothetical protein I1A62_02045 (plasmid) [Rhodococcus sp. USK10]|nr:hypothetical protein [Rhodococcus sp. USK10]QYA99945.1 hypothetical protein I1A62_02045 [Rhodococcus sp. USK10]